MNNEQHDKWAHNVDTRIDGDFKHSSFSLCLRSATPAKAESLRQLSFDVSQRLQEIALSDMVKSSVGFGLRPAD
jgi:hypothetical protein